MAADDWIDPWDMWPDLDYRRLYYFDEAESGYWIDVHGQRIKFKKMKLAHLVNSLKMLLHGRANSRVDVIPFLAEEIRKRPGGKFILAQLKREGLYAGEL